MTNPDFDNLLRNKKKIILRYSIPNFLTFNMFKIRFWRSQIVLTFKTENMLSSTDKFYPFLKLPHQFRELIVKYMH